MEDTRIAELEAKVAELTALVERLAPATPTVGEALAVSPPTGGTPGTEEAPAVATSRRRMLRNVALVAGGAVAATVATGALPAAAAHQAEDLGLGLVNTTGGKTTLNGVGVAGSGNVLLVQAGASYTTDASAYPAAIAAWAEDANHPTGLYAYTAAPGDGQAIAAVGVGDQSYGISVSGVRAPIFMEPSGASGPARTDAHQAGELIVDYFRQVWLCVTSGTPGTWRSIAAPLSAGAFYPISQVRVYDSRSAAPTPGKLGSGAARVVSVKDGRNPASGAVTLANAVPVGATAVTGNITVTNSTGALGGFLTIMPGDAGAAVGSSVNWFGPAQNIANSFTAKLDANRQLKVFGGGAPNPDTDFILDISGYYL